MNLCNIVKKSKLLTNGCKRYYDYLLKLLKESTKNNWRITSGDYKNHLFIIPTDTVASERLFMGLTSIYKYKKTLKSLGLIDIIPKFTVRTNVGKNKNYCHRQITIVSQTMPKKFISKSLIWVKNIKKATILKTSNYIISQFKKNLNNAIFNIHTKIKKILNTVTNTNNSYINNLNKDDVQTITNMLNTYNIKFKNKEIASYAEMYKKSKEKFNQTCKYCSDKDMYAPLKYFTKVFYASVKPKNVFFNFQQRDYDYEKLEAMLVNRFDL